jgi:hypothetical protein
MTSTSIAICWATLRAAWKTWLKPEAGRGMHLSCSPISKVRQQRARHDGGSRFSISCLADPAHSAVAQALVRSAPVRT